MGALDRYNDNLRNARPPGTGAHGWILSTANLGTISGLAGEQIFSDIRRSIPTGTRRISDGEILAAINKALGDHRGGTCTPRLRTKPVVNDGAVALQRIIEQGKITTEVDLWEASPIRLWDDPQGDPALLIKTLFGPDDLIWIGDRHQAGIMGDTIRTASALITYFRNGGKAGPHIVVNPLTGTPAPTKAGDGETLRGDGNVASYRYCLAEFDTLSREDQIKFWSAAKLPIVALIDSGGKSIHAWLAVKKLAPVDTLEQWQSEIKNHLYARLLAPLAVDQACSNPARLSRLPGHYRAEKAAWQRLLWLSPEGRTVC
jgi:hypothetical protein